MKFIEITALEQLSPQDHLLYMQGVWAQITELGLERIETRMAFLEFSRILDKLEIFVVENLGKEEKFALEISRTLNMLREEIDGRYFDMLKLIEEQDQLRIVPNFERKNICGV